MKDRQRHCMNRRIFISFAALCACAGLFAKGGSDFMSKSTRIPVTTRYELIQQRNLYLEGNNIAGMRADSVNISNALVEAGYVFGQGRQSFEAPRTWNAGINASSIMHRRRISLFGKFAFSHSAMYDACGSMFITPGKYPVDVLEFTPGEKSLQNYSFTGGISADVAEHWRLGARVDFSASNYAKLKDLRYTDYALDFSLKPGIQWVDGDFNVGASLIVERSTETISAEQISVSNDTYYAFLNKGLWYGVYQAWNGGGIHLDEVGISGLPLSRIGLGASLQLGWKGLFTELSYVHGNGRSGEKDAVWFRFPDNGFTGRVAYKHHDAGAVEHIFMLDAAFTNTMLHESVIERVTSGGVTIRHDYGSNLILNKDVLTLRPSWTVVKEGVFDAGASFEYGSQKAVGTQQYPLVAEQSVDTFRGEVYYNRYIAGRVLLGGTLWAGGGLLYDNMRSVSETESPSLYRQEDYFSAWTDYATKIFCGGNLQLRYIFANNMYLCALIQSEYRLRNHRTGFNFGFGYNF